MQFILYKVRHYPLSLLIFVVILYLSFFTPPSINLNKVAFADKWVHILMYFGFSFVMWIEYIHCNKNIRWFRLLILTWLVPMLMGALIEVLQENFTGERRNGDVLDAIANAIGASVASIIMIVYIKFIARKKSQLGHKV